MTRIIARPFQSVDFLLYDTDFFPRHKTALKQSKVVFLIPTPELFLLGKPKLSTIFFQAKDPLPLKK